jgi:RHS repeat-associated protein
MFADLHREEAVVNSFRTAIRVNQITADSQSALESGKAVVDEADSVTGLKSFRIETDGTGELVVAKRLSLPSRVPFGVSEGNFVIGVAKTASQVKTISRSSLVEELGLGDRSDRSRKEEDRVSDRKSETANEEQVPGIAKAGHAPSGSGDKTMKLMSASPVGNYYLYSFDGKLLQTYNVYGILLKDYIYMGDRLIAEYDHVGSRFLYYSPDQINSTRVITDSAGTVVYSVTYDPYGGVQIPDQYNTINPLPKFSGKERDAESELDYFGARYYDKNQYRFISVDPETKPGGARSDTQLLNLYTYCRNNPTAFLDPDGNASFHFVFNTKEVRSGYLSIGIIGWGKPAPGYDLVVSDSRGSLDAVGYIDILVLKGTSLKWLLPWVAATPFHTEVHEMRHLEEIEKYVNKRIQELEPLWTKEGCSKEEISKRINILVQEGAEKTKDKWDRFLGLGHITDWFESWYYRFNMPFGVQFKKDQKY